MRLFAIDLDGTLLKDDKTYNRKRFNQLIEKLNQDIFIIATGNRLEKLNSYIDNEIIDHIYLAPENGNLLIKNGSIQMQNTMPLEIVKQVIWFIENFEGFYPLISTPSHVLVSEKDYNIIKQYDKFNSAHKIYHNFNIQEPVHRISVFSLRSHEDNLRFTKLVRQIKQVSSVTSGGGWLDVYMSGGGKGLALQYLQQTYNIPFSKTFTFGDSLNDASMFVRSENSYAMANGDPFLQKIATHIIGTNENESVLDILETFYEEC